MTGILDHKRLRKKHGIHGCYSFSILIVTILVIASYSSAEVVKGRVTSAEGDAIELNLGSERGIRPGDSGRVYYTVTIDRNERAIYVAIFRITRVTDKSSTAQVHEKTTQVRAGLLVEVTVGEGELEIRSEKRAVGELSINTDPSGASIYFDGKSVGVSSYEAKDLAPRSYKIRISKEGYEVWEKEEVVETGKKTEVLAQLKAIEGTLEIVSEPSGAKVYIDGNEIGETPLYLASMRMGQYAIRVVMEGHVPYEQRVEVKGKDRQRVSALLKKAAGELIVRTEPPGANVFSNGKPVGTTPYEGKDLPPGTYRVRIMKEGYGIWEGALTVISGRTVEVPIELKAKEGGLEVQSVPSRAKVYLDGKEFGETPLALSGIRLGQHVIQVTREGYESHEEQVSVTEGEKKKILASLKKVGGDLFISTEPSGAIVYVDGKSVGLSPYEGKTLSPGACRVRIMKEGYETWEKEVVIGVGKRVEVLAQLRAKEGGLEILSEPSGAKIYLDEKERGQTPFVLSGVQLGEHLVRVVKEGYETYEEKVRIIEGNNRVSASLKRVRGDLSINTEPPRSDLHINGRSVGTSPYEGKDLQPGTYTVKVVKEGYETREMDVVVKAGELSKVRIDLKERKEVAAPSPPAKPETKMKEAPKVMETHQIAAEAPKAERDVDWTKGPCEAPVWKVGDKWILREPDGRTLTREVVDVKDDLFIVKILNVEGMSSLVAYDKKTINLKFTITQDGRKIINMDYDRKLFDFPIFVGKKWTDTVNSMRSEFKIEGIEVATTAAGTFKAYKILYSLTDLRSQANRSGWIRYWYSPDVKWNIKREVENTSFWPKRILNRELISYELK